MFTKLLKHEWRATRGMLGTLCLVCLGAGLLGGGTMRYLMIAAQQSAIDILIVLAMVAAMIAVGVAALLLYIGRFYKSRFTDEGYLTFTLPVNTHQNLLASMANSAIGMVIIFFVICAALMLWLMIGLPGMGDFIKMVWEKFPELWDSLKRVWSTIPWKFVWMFLLNVLTGCVCELVLLMLSVTIGSIIAKKHKILAAVGVYYGINVLISMTCSATLAVQAFSSSEGAQVVFRVFTSSAVMTAGVAIAGYFLMYWLVDRKLNLN